MSSQPKSWDDAATRAAATILRATASGARATKIHTSDGRGGWTTQGYSRDGMAFFSASPFEAHDLRSFAARLKVAAADPRALLVAEVPRPEANTSRMLRRVRGQDATLMRHLAGQQWICWEVDGVDAEVPASADPRQGADAVSFAHWWMQAHLPESFAAASAVLQWSSSALITGRLTFHLWQWLDRPVSRESIHAWAQAHKHDSPRHWSRAVDTTIWDGARVHYIADPIFMDPSGQPMPDPVAERWVWVQGQSDEAAALPQWEDEEGWCIRLERARAEAAEAKERAAESRARLSAGRGASAAQTDDETGSICDLAALPCPLDDLDPKRVLAWAAHAMASLEADVAGAAKGGRHDTIRRAGLIAGSILSGLDELGLALTPEADARVGWGAAVRGVEAAAESVEAAAAGSGSEGGGVTFQWAVRIGRETAVVPDYRLQERYRPSVLAAKKAARGSGGGKVVQLRRVSLPAYEGQEAVDTMIEVEVDEETGEVVDRAPSKGEAEAWRRGLKLNKAGYPKGTILNLEMIAINDPAFGAIKWNDLAAALEVWGSPAWAKGVADGTPLEDHHVGELQIWLQRAYGCEATENTVWALARVIGRRNAYDPLRDYLRGLVWDGTPRIFRFATDYLNGKDTEAARLAGGWWLMAAAHRALEPGCQSDYVLTLEGAQGLSKSQLIKRLSPERKLTMTFQDDPASPKAVEKLRGKWLIELAELSVLGKGRDMRIVKGFVTTEADDYRAPWARTPAQYPRRCAFLATVNPEGEGGYLSDSTGNRRWWPVSILKPIDLEAVERDRDQLWAEAVARLDRGEKHYPDEDQQARLFRPEQREREDEHVWTQRIYNWAAARGKVTTEGVMEFAVGIPPERHTRRDQMTVAAILQSLGWKRGEKRGVSVGEMLDGNLIQPKTPGANSKRWWAPPDGWTSPNQEVGANPF